MIDFDKFNAEKHEYIKKGICDILNKWDPMGIFFGDNFFEYEPEYVAIVNNINFDSSISEIKQVIIETFNYYFNEQNRFDNCDEIAKKVKDFLTDFLDKDYNAFFELKDLL